VLEHAAVARTHHAVVEITGWVCPLTDWEVALRRSAGGAAYTESFVEHYLIPVLYPTGLTRSMQLVLASLVIAVNAAAYVGYARRRRELG